LSSADLRQLGDYGLDPDIQNEVVVEMIRQAQEFLEVAKEYLAAP